MVAMALQQDGYYLRSEIIWHKKACMPESVTDRPTRAHEQLFLLSKNAQYFYDADAIAEPAIQPVGVPLLTGQIKRGELQSLSSSNLGTNQGASTRNKRSVWTLGPESYSGAHYATMPTKLVEPCVLAGSRPGDTVLDPFFGSGTTAAVALKHGRRFIGCDIDERNINLAHDRISKSQPMLFALDAAL
jgi:site-specific DNA-methyltransferase (cytosine-N4-specific)